MEAPLLRVFPNLKDIWLVEWTERRIRYWPEFQAADWRWRDEHELWVCSPVQEGDCLLSLFARKNVWRSNVQASGGQLGEGLMNHRKQHGDGACYFRHARRALAK
ncbi:hypothetical protein ACJ41O_009359 [Fusarium nematophilum]